MAKSALQSDNTAGAFTIVGEMEMQGTNICCSCQNDICSSLWYAVVSIQLKCPEEKRLALRVISRAIHRVTLNKQRQWWHQLCRGVEAARWMSAQKLVASELSMLRNQVKMQLGRWVGSPSLSLSLSHTHTHTHTHNSAMKSNCLGIFGPAPGRHSLIAAAINYKSRV